MVQASTVTPQEDPLPGNPGKGTEAGRTNPCESNQTPMAQVSAWISMGDQYKPDRGRKLSHCPGGDTVTVPSPSQESPKVARGSDPG